MQKSLVLPVLETKRTILRLACQDDLEEIISYYQRNKKHLEPFEPIRNDHFYTISYWSSEVSDRLQDFREDRSLKLFLFFKNNPQEIIGSINFGNFIRGVFQSCTLGYSLAEKFQGQGLMTKALEVAIKYVFKEVNLHRIMAVYLPHNQSSGRLLKRLGFMVEGYMYDYLMINGQWQDHIFTSLLNPHWQSKINNLPLENR